jgi:C1A family cysteine protease
MEKENSFYDLLPETARVNLRKFGVKDNEELISWLTRVPDQAAQLIGISPVLIEEIKMSSFYLSCSTNNESRRFGYVPQKPELLFGRSVSQAEDLDVILDMQFREVDMSSLFPGVSDQGNTPSCAGHAFKNIMESKLDWKHDLSGAFIYNRAKTFDNNSLDGTRLSSCIKALLKYGVLKTEGSLINNDSLLVEPTPSELEMARKIRLKKYEARNGESKVKWLMKQLTLGLCVAAGLYVFPSAWENEIARKYGKILMPYPGEVFNSGHAIAFVGFYYDEVAPGGGYFIFINSWSENWGKDDTYCRPGFGIVSFEYVKNYMDEAYVVTEIEDLSEPAEALEYEADFPVDDTFYVPAAKANHWFEEVGHKAVIGTSGSGKTTYVQESLQKIKGVHRFIIDPHADIVKDDDGAFRITDRDQAFLKNLDPLIWDVREHGLPFNLLVPNLGMNEIDHVDWLVGLFKVSMRELGSQQLSLLTEEIEKLVGAQAANPENSRQLQFSDMLLSLENRIENSSGRRRSTAESLLTKLKPVLRGKILNCTNDESSVEFIRNNECVVFRCKVADGAENIMRLISIFIVSAIFSVYKMTSIGKKCPGVIVHDEFHLAPKHKVYENITREGRKYNVFLWAISQTVEEVKELLPNANKKKIFRVANGQQAKLIANCLGWSNKNKKEIEERLAILERFECLDETLFDLR